MRKVTLTDNDRGFHPVCIFEHDKLNAEDERA